MTLDNTYARPQSTQHFLQIKARQQAPLQPASRRPAFPGGRACAVSGADVGPGARAVSGGGAPLVQVSADAPRAQLEQSPLAARHIPGCHGMVRANGGGVGADVPQIPCSSTLQDALGRVRSSWLSPANDLTWGRWCP